MLAGGKKLVESNAEIFIARNVLLLNYEILDTVNGFYILMKKKQI